MTRFGPGVDGVTNGDIDDRGDEREYRRQTAGDKHGGTLGMIG